MPYMQKTFIMGHLGRDPEVRHVGDANHAVCSFSVAVRPDYRDKEHTDWYDVSIWGKRGEAAAQYFNKGDPILCFGGLKLRKYTKKDGTDGVSLDLMNADWNFVGSKGDSTPLGEAPPAETTQDDIPF